MGCEEQGGGMKESTILIGGRAVGPGQPVYVVAEMSANHGHRLDRAVEIVRAAKEAGADAVKLQTYTADTLTIDSDKECFRIGKGTLWEGRTLYDLYREAYTPWEWHPRLKEVAEEVGLDFFSTPFDKGAVDFLEELGVGAYKIASFENVDVGLIEYVGRTGKPVIVSTGMATLGEVREAVQAARSGGAGGVALLKCTSAYPAPPGEMNLRAMERLAREFHVPVGLSDHTLGTAVAVAAVALGASIIEKHFTLSRDLAGPDSAFSLEPGEFREMASAVRTAQEALGDARAGITPREEASRMFRRSLFVVEDMRKGETFSQRNVRSIRPGHGLAPKHLGEVLGRRAARDIERGTPMSWDMVDMPPPVKNTQERTPS